MRVRAVTFTAGQPERQLRDKSCATNIFPHPIRTGATECDLIKIALLSLAEYQSSSKTWCPTPLTDGFMPMQVLWPATRPSPRSLTGPLDRPEWAGRLARPPNLMASEWPCLSLKEGTHRLEWTVPPNTP